MFGALMELLRRPGDLPVLLFILVFKLPDAAMGFMVKPFWVDVGFSAAQIGLVSVNIGLALSIAGGIVGGWITDRIGIFTQPVDPRPRAGGVESRLLDRRGRHSARRAGRERARSSTWRSSMRRARRSRSPAGSAPPRSSRS